MFIHGYNFVLHVNVLSLVTDRLTFTNVRMFFVCMSLGNLSIILYYQPGHCKVCMSDVITISQSSY